MKTQVRIGWTKHDERDAEGYPTFKGQRYGAFFDPYQPGQAQHTEDIEVDFNVGGVDLALDGQQVAVIVYDASNRLGAFGPPSPTGDESVSAKVQRAIHATGYTGREAHFSLSIGDTVTVHPDTSDEITYACTREGWEIVKLEVTPTVVGLPREWREIARGITVQAENPVGARVRDAYRNAADQLEVAMPTWGDFRKAIEAEAGYLDSEALDHITDAVVRKLGDSTGVRVGAYPR